MKHLIRRHSAGFTLVELLVVILIIVALAVISVTVASRMKKSADEAVSAANLRQVGIALVTYTAENNRFPSLLGDAVWDRCVIPHLGFTEPLTGTGVIKPSAFRSLEGIVRIFASPADKQTRPEDTYKRSIAIVPWTTNWSNGTAFRGWKDIPYNKGIRYSMLNSPEKAAMVVQWFEGTSGIPNNLGHGNHAFHDMGGPQKLLGNYQQVLFADGHVEKISARIKNADFVAKYWPGTIGSVN